MILRPSTRPQSLLQAFVRPQNALRSQQRRHIQYIPSLGRNNDRGNYFDENGVPGFLSAKTYRHIWKDYQQFLLDQVNEPTQENAKFVDMEPLKLHILMSHYPEQASLYNAAAMLHMNHFWWESIAKEKIPIQPSLQKAIENSFGSVDELRIEMLQHADAMFGNGFVWLMQEGVPEMTSALMGGSKLNTPLRIMCTYNAGSPWPEAAKRKQDKDMATIDPERLTASGGNLTQVQNDVGSFGNHSKIGKRPSSPLLTARPILCANVWQHAYMSDYGLLGKKLYLQAWWERIDWNEVANRHSGMEKDERNPRHLLG